MTSGALGAKLAALPGNEPVSSHDSASQESELAPLLRQVDAGNITGSIKKMRGGISPTWRATAGAGAGAGSLPRDGAPGLDHGAAATIGSGGVYR
jgi:hypothetical protein